MATIARGDLWISEILFNVPGTNELRDQFIELRGTPNLFLTNVYFVAVEGDLNGDPGTVLDVFDLSGVRVGGNGYLVVLQSSNAYAFSPDATVLANTNGAGFGSGASSSIRHHGKGGQTSLQSASTTFFLVQANASPSPGDDIDPDNDGLPDGPVFSTWAVLDSVGVLDHDGAGDIAYGRINFRRSDGAGVDATALTGTIVGVPFTPGYVARVHGSTNWTAADWVAVDQVAGTRPNWKLTRSNTFPPASAGATLNPLGTPSFGERRMPAVLVRQARGAAEITEGGAPGRYSIGLSVPCRKGMTIEIEAPAALEISIDRGRTYAPKRTITLSGVAPRPVFVRARNDDVVGPLRSRLEVAHRIIRSGDPLRYPIEATIVPPATVFVTDDDRLLLNEIDGNPPVADDATFEFVELRGTPNALLGHVQLLAINSDTKANTGIATVVDLFGQRVGANGLLLIVSPGHPYIPAADTTVVLAPQFAQAGGALHNGAVSFLLVHTTNALPDGIDLDAGDNGVLEKLPPDTVVLDSIAWLDEPSTDLAYTDAVIVMPSGSPDAATRFKHDDRPNTAAAWFGGQLAGATGESLVYDDRHVTTNFPHGTLLSPGTVNNTAPQISPLGAFTSTIGDPTAAPVRFTVFDAEAPVKTLVVAAHSSNPAVVPDDHLIVSGTGVERSLSVHPVGVGYATITLTISDGALSGERSFAYAASADERGGGRFHCGASDGSTAYAIDSRWMLIGDDENQKIRLYSRSNSGPAVASFDMSPYLALTDLYESGAPKEVDIEASTHVGNRIFWLGSHSHSGDAQIQTNRARIFATDISGAGTNAALHYLGRYEYLKADLLNWDAHGEHGRGNFYYGLVDSSAPGVDPKSTNGSGFNIEGLAMAPRSTNAAYLGFRAPLVPPAARTYALVVPVTNFAALAMSDGPPGSARFGEPIELNLGGRGVRSMEGTGTNYLIVAGPPGPATGIAPLDFKLFTWTGRPGDQPRQHGADLTGMNPEGIVSLPPLPWTSNSVVQLVSDNGTTVLYGDGIEAKHLSTPEFKKCRTDWVRLGPVVTPQPFIRTAERIDGRAMKITWHSFAGVRYRVQTKASLSDSPWTDLPGETTASNALSAILVDPTESHRFFRVLAIPANR